MGLEEKLNQAKGAIKQGAGKLTLDKKVETEGAIEKTVAKAKDSIKDIKDGVEGAAEGIKSTFSNKE
ncbi:CsbD family protein [Streptococcus mutans]|uniref:CsbD family protein n=1 Tax=Streptococcus mutans TaxID=1309 RepID=UPI002988D89D|nr:CsbD family protein [Streptococcus mutans]MDW5565172.1 CsbD family protein [Streptococcus mutans]